MGHFDLVLSVSDVVLFLHLALVVFVMRVRVQEKNRECYKVSLVNGNKYPGIAFAVAIRKSLEQTVNLLSLLRQLHLHQHLSDGHINRFREVRESSHVLPQASFGELVRSLTQDGSNETSRNGGLKFGEIACWRVLIGSFWKYHFSWDLK